MSVRARWNSVSPIWHQLLDSTGALIADLYHVHGDRWSVEWGRGKDPHLRVLDAASATMAQQRAIIFLIGETRTLLGSLQALSGTE